MDSYEEMTKEANQMKFNEVVHIADEHGDPKRNEDGSIQLRTNWKKVAVDRQGRTYNKHVHGDEQELDSEGFLKVRRKKERTTAGHKNRSEAFVAKYYEKGYAYYIANDVGGRLEQMTDEEWEPVLDGKGPASMSVGQARYGNTEGRLFRKPIEWYEADQEAKVQSNKERFKQTITPNEDEGQYEAAATSPLR